MTITLTQVQRRFVYNGTMLADPSPSMSVEEVKGIYEHQYPDLATATVEGPNKKGEVMEYEFKRKVGTKG